MKNRIAAAALSLFTLAAAPAAADRCGGTYTVQKDDSLSVIADRLYKDAGMWSAIHNRNIEKIGPRPGAIRVGMKLSLACLNGLPLGMADGKQTAATRAKAVPVKVQPGHAAVRGRINLLTGDDYAPFTSKAAHNGGLITDVVNAAMIKAAPQEGYAIHWVNDWASHFDPLLANALLDAGFPWYRPDCETMPEAYRCQNFHFSEPMFETLMLLFAAKDRPFAFEEDADMEGKVLCRPTGYLTFDLEERGRRWITENKITLKQPHKVKECFDMVARGEADAVAVNEFTGRSVMQEHGLEAQFTVLPQPLSVLGIYAVVHKSHPRAQELLAMFNRGLRAIQADGSYQAIIDGHMARIWAGF
ncbi:peptidoglycan-binding protein LysM [Cribrihabitans pelagius]|uniref:peptidoglycan-binding protein LysM n=1 Tax=Cribrihabitans pelagius TaxID=1765746 RepID=UPI003B58BFDB